MKLILSNLTRISISKTIFLQLLPKAEKVLKKEGRFSDGLIELILVNDRTMHQLNRKYRGKDGTTDVISFSFLESPESLLGLSPKIPRILGEVYISVPTARRQAKQYGYSLDQELRLLFIHGLLHVFGYDHERSASEARKMRKLEGAILSLTFSSPQ